MCKIIHGLLLVKGIVMDDLFCEFKLMDNQKLLECTNCGHIVQLRDEKQKFLCKHKIIQESIKQKKVKFLRTEKIERPTDSNQLNSENKQQCSQEQIDARLSVCKSCEFYDKNTCLKCGCSLSRDKVFMNKLYWPDQSCPIGKWGPILPEES